MMLRQIVLLALLFSGLAGCKPKSAFKYSEDIIAKEKSLVPEIQATEEKIKNFITTERYDSIAAAGVNMENQVQKKIDEIKSMSVPEVKQADNFKKASIRYFEYIKSMYTGYKNWGNAESKEERDQILESLLRIVEGKQAALNDMQAAQRIFASVNGFKVK